MKIRNFKYANQAITHVYITRTESINPDILNKIETIKNNGQENIVVFISGNLEMVPQLKQIIMYQKNAKELDL